MNSSLDVAVVSRDEEVRLAAARAFDHAPSAWTVRLHERPPDDADVIVFGSDMQEGANNCLVFAPESGERIVDRIKSELGRTDGSVYLVTGAGAGVGVTSVALHLARLTAEHSRTCFVDANTTWSSAPRLGIDGPHLTWAELGRDEESREADPPVALPISGGFRALLAPDAFEPDGFQRALTFAREKFERVVIDCSERQTLATGLECADVGILVVPCTSPGAHRGAAVLERYPDVRWAIVLNRLGPGGELTRAAVHRVLGHKTTLQLPCAPALRDAEDESRLLTSPWSRYARAISRLHSALESAEQR